MMHKRHPIMCPPRYVVRDHYIPRIVPHYHPVININRHTIVNIPRHINIPIRRNVIVDPGYPPHCGC